MANLKEIRLRITSVGSTMQITSAMKMVSAAKLKRAQDAIIQMRPYANKLTELLENLSASLDADDGGTYSKERAIKNVLLVTITSNRGLCGGFNSYIIKSAKALMNDEFENVNVEVLSIGKKSSEHFTKNDFNVVDARSRERFEGKVAEPRKGLRSGSIKNSFCLPFGELINDDHTFVGKDKISEKFKSFNFDHSKNIVFSCGSGVTASVLALAYSLINDKYMPTIYDGSWSEYGKS